MKINTRVCESQQVVHTCDYCCGRRMLSVHPGCHTDGSVELVECSHTLKQRCTNTRALRTVTNSIPPRPPLVCILACIAVLLYICSIFLLSFFISPAIIQCRLRSPWCVLALFTCRVHSEGVGRHVATAIPPAGPQSTHG